jgi:hypothetical protein
MLLLGDADDATSRGTSLVVSPGRGVRMDDGASADRRDALTPSGETGGDGRVVCVTVRSRRVARLPMVVCVGYRVSNYRASSPVSPGRAGEPDALAPGLGAEDRVALGARGDNASLDHLPALLAEAVAVADRCGARKVRCRAKSRSALISCSLGARPHHHATRSPKKQPYGRPPRRKARAGRSCSSPRRESARLPLVRAQRRMTESRYS